jgi:hypothetical protein
MFDANTQTKKQTGQQQYVPHYSGGGHKQINENIYLLAYQVDTDIIYACTLGSKMIFI